jgi:transketolase
MYKGTREAFSAAMGDLVQVKPEVVMISADSKLAARAKQFSLDHPKNFIEVGISEQCAVDVASGLARCGKIPYVATYAGFITMRACEQVRTFVAYPNMNVKLIGFNGGLLGGEREGTTHQFYEDISILRAIPNINILCPSNQEDAFKATKMVADIQGPCYIRLGSGKEKNNEDFCLPELVFGKGRTLLEKGSQVAILFHGFVINETIKAVLELEKQGIGATLVEIPTIVPLDTALIKEVCTACKAVVTVEDHNINGALGSAVCEVIAEQGISCRLKRLGLTSFGESGTPEELYRAYGLDSNHIVEAVKTLI